MFAMPDEKPFHIDPDLPITEQLKQLRLARSRGIGELAASTGLSRLTVSAVESQKSDARISSLSALFDELGYVLMPVPKPLAREVANFINNGGRSVSLPAGQAAPMGVGQRAFHQAAQVVRSWSNEGASNASQSAGEVGDRASFSLHALPGKDSHRHALAGTVSDARLPSTTKGGASAAKSEDKDAGKVGLSPKSAQRIPPLATVIKGRGPK